MKKTVLNTALSTAFIVALTFGISACSGDKEGEHGSHEVLAKDRVDEAAEMARANAPAAEKMEFPETAPMPVAAADGAATAEAGATDVAATTEAGATDASMAEATATTNSTDADATDSAQAATPVAAPQ